MSAPFQGGATCAICSAVILFDPNVDSGWRLIEVDDAQHFVCPKHFPPDHAPRDQFSRAYRRVLAALMKPPRN